MKTGYSLLLGEYIESSILDYSDYKNFQIVCPACKEPVFKVVRNRTEEDIHYLSHYEKDKAYTQECELRVSNMSISELKKVNAISRNQKLTLFLNVLKETITEILFNQKEIPHPDAQHFTNLSMHRSIVWLRGEARKVWEADFGGIMIDSLFEDYINDIKEVAGQFDKTSFSLSIQKRIAKDFFHHLLTPPARPNFNFCFNSAYYFLISRLRVKYETSKLSEWEKYMTRCMISMMIDDEDGSFLILEKLRNYKMPQNYDGDSTNLLGRLMSDISHEMLGLLLRLPYFEILRRNNNGSNLHK